jgi:hypothetical protein
MWQAPIPDLALDGKPERFLVHGGLAGGAGSEYAKFTGVSTSGDVNPQGQGAGDAERTTEDHPARGLGRRVGAESLSVC